MALTNLTSNDRLSKVIIDNGELISFKKFGEELIHQKGSEGWSNSDTEMFPIIGPTKANNYQVSTKKGKGIQDQHGFLGEMNYTSITATNILAAFEKNYKTNSQIKNRRFPKISNEKFLFFPYDFKFKKSFELFDDALHIQFELSSEKGMPFMLGYHPAFKLSGKGDEIINIKKQKITLDQVLEKGGAAYPFFDVNKLTLIKKEGYNIHIKTKGFNNFMFWTEVKNMICIEPITQYPELEKQSYSEKNMQISNGKEIFSITIMPFKGLFSKKVF
jgi:galactose mutarotase-like enzyme